MRSSKTRVLLATLLAVAAGSQALAADPVVTIKTETVRFDDLRLISNVGAAQLYARMSRAAERACDGPIDTSQLARYARYRACVDEAIAKAVADVNHPVLNGFYETKRAAARAAAKNPSSAVAENRE
jgi:UrcA family protein